MCMQLHACPVLINVTKSLPKEYTWGVILWPLFSTFLATVMVKLTKMVRGPFLMLIKVGMRLTDFNRRHLRKMHRFF